MKKFRAQHLRRSNAAGCLIQAAVLGGFVILTGCAPQASPPGGASATLNIKIDSALGDAGIDAGPLPALFNGFKQQTAVVSKFQEQGEVDKTIQIPADQDDTFVFNEIFANHRFRCTLKFGIRPNPNQTYLLIVGDIRRPRRRPTRWGKSPMSWPPETFRAATFIATTSCLAAACNLPPSNDQTFEPSVIP